MTNIIDNLEANIAGSQTSLGRIIAFVGLMGAGKSTVGRRVASALNVEFCDVDDEIIVAAGRPIADIFQTLGADEFRAGERRVIARLLEKPPHILATGGGAFVNSTTRELLREKAVTVWLRADLDTLMQRVSRRNDRPLLQNDDPRGTMESLMQERYPIYAEADIIVDSVDGPHGQTVAKVIQALRENGLIQSAK
ncbi:MAG: shikimate kinase [Hyphomonadaceae bacterium]|nr:MAG: shikimate kinase [Hyphomonadaceae bacterium]KAF0185876.1 MAG: shikimate kinase [Hyphomonadaceae bacterium]